MVKGLIVAIVAAVAFIVYSLVDCLTVERARFRALNRPLWAVVIVILPVIGAILWFVLGRSHADAVGRRILAPDDDPDFLGSAGISSFSGESLDRRTTDEQIRKIERDFAEHDDDNQSPQEA